MVPSIPQVLPTLRVVTSLRVLRLHSVMGHKIEDNLSSALACLTRLEELVCIKR